MNRKIPVRVYDPVRVVGLQTMLIGMEATLDNRVREINDVRDELSLPHITVLRGNLPPQTEEGVPLRHQREMDEQPVRQLTEAVSQRIPVARKQRGLGKKVAFIWKAKRAILEAAGMNRSVRGMPSNKLIAKAERKLKRLGIAIPGAQEEPPARKTVATGSLREKQSHRNPMKRTAKKAGRPGNVPVTKVVSANTKKLIGGSSKARWALAIKAGLKPKTVPGKEMLEEARRILAQRKEDRKKLRGNAVGTEQTQARESANPPEEVQI